MTLSDEELDRYARQIVLPDLGGTGQRRLTRSSIVLIGAGAIGSAALSALAGAGIGRLTIVDPDEIELSNLHRQFIYREDQYADKSEPPPDSQGMAELIIGKQRNGPTGVVKLAFIREFTRFENLAAGGG